MLVILILIAVLSFIKLPYYITKPGEATELASLIKVEGGYPEKGSLSLMTVKVDRLIRLHMCGQRCTLIMKLFLMRALRKKASQIRSI